MPLAAGCQRKNSKFAAGLACGFDQDGDGRVQLEFRVEHGPVAQLGARVNGIHEVTGSIPVWSTISKLLIPND
jgi:hypothetical protein